MRLVSLDSLLPGSRLGQDVHVLGSDGPPLLRRGVTLEGRYVAALKSKGIFSVWVEDALSEGIRPVRPISAETERRTVAAIGDALTSAREGLTSGRGLSSDAVDNLSKVSLLIADEVHNAPEVAMHLSDMMGADKYLLQHIVDVTALGTVLAARLFREKGWTDHLGQRRRDDIDPRLAKIALGLLLHDIGKLAIPDHILQKDGPLTQDEWAEMRKHPEMGVTMLGDNVSFLIKAVVKQHHERFDGTGYPDGLEGESIHEFARIAAVADVYDAVTSERVYKAAAPPHEGVRIINEGAGTAFAPDVVEIFNRVVFPYPPGSEVRLADGRLAVVAEVEGGDPQRPTVRVMSAAGVEEIRDAELATQPERLAA